MAIPSYDEFIEPLLRYLAAQPEPVPTSTAYTALADAVGPTPEDRAALLPSGTLRVYHNRIGWANDRLRRMGFTSSPSTSVILRVRG
jgi:restriction system protein